jgi:glycosyltransferase involved in cell wall biosynthesis
VGRFQAEKNHTFLLNVFTEYLKLNANAMLLLVGKGPLMDDIRQKTLQLGINGKVYFLGERSDVPNLLQAMDLFLMPSTFEGQPFVLIEAQCSGLPCLISDVINDDICLTSHIEKMALTQTAEAWAQNTCAMLQDYQRQDESPSIEAQGYSIRSTIDYLEKVYNSEA